VVAARAVSYEEHRSGRLRPYERAEASIIAKHPSDIQLANQVLRYWIRLDTVTSPSLVHFLAELGSPGVQRRESQRASLLLLPSWRLRFHGSLERIASR